MGTAVVILAIVGIVGFFIWVLMQPNHETALGRENRLRRQANKEAKRQNEGGGRDLNRS